MKPITKPNLKRLAAAAVIALALPLSLSAFAGPPGAMRGDCAMGGFSHPGLGGDGLPRYLHRLNLSEAQRDRVFDIMHAQAPVMRDAMKAFSQARNDLRTLATAPDFDEARARSLTDALAAATGEMALNRIKTERQVFDVLTPEQRKQVADWQAEGPRRAAGDVSRPMRGR